MDLTGLRKYLKSEHIFHQDFWNPRGEEGMKTWQTNLKWQVLHFSCSTLETRYPILTEVIIFITAIKEGNTCHLPDFWERLNFPLFRGSNVALAGGKCHYFIEWCLFYLPRRLYLGEPVLCREQNSHCWTRSKGSSLWTQQGQTFWWGRMGGSCPAGCSSWGWPSLLQPGCWRWWRSGCSTLHHGDLLPPWLFCCPTAWLWESDSPPMFPSALLWGLFRWQGMNFFSCSGLNNF